jgi:hypothetical protein
MADVVGFATREGKYLYVAPNENFRSKVINSQLLNDQR